MRRGDGATHQQRAVPATWFYGCITIEKIHPLEGGFVRRKYRTARRPGFPIVPALHFYPGYYAETAAVSCSTGAR